MELNDAGLRTEADFHDAFYEESADRIYDSYAYSLVKERNLGFVLGSVPSPGEKELLSLGCGNGSFEGLLSSRFKRVVGVDLSPRAIELAEERRVARGITNLGFSVGNARTIDFPVASFDVVLVLSTFHHLSEADMLSLMVEARRVLRPGGRLLSVDPNYYRLVGGFKFLVAKTFAKYHSPGERVIPPSLVTSLLGRAGFERASVRWLDFFYNPLCWVFPGMPPRLADVLSGVDRAVVHVPLLRRLGNAFGVAARR